VEKPSEDPEFNVETSECKRLSAPKNAALHADWWREAVNSQTKWRLDPLPSTLPLPATLYELYAPGAAPNADAVPSTQSYRLPQRMYADWN
jgi:hypothetical protein